MKLTTLDELFLHELKDLYDAEHQLVDALPAMAKAATDPDLKSAFTSHLAETRKQVTRLKDVFQEFGDTPEREECDGMKGLIEEAEKLMDDAEDPTVRDAALIAAAQKVEHYEIATYGTLITWARLAGLASAQQLLEQSLEEEKAADEKLTDIAESSVNAAAEFDDADEDEEATPARGRSRTTASRAQAGTPARSRRATK
jgi:ferritin-like metal-binding protein YciE